MAEQSYTPPAPFRAKRMRTSLRGFCVKIRIFLLQTRIDIIRTHAAAKVILPRSSYETTARKLMSLRALRRKEGIRNARAYSPRWHDAANLTNFSPKRFAMIRSFAGCGWATACAYYRYCPMTRSKGFISYRSASTQERL